MGEPVEVGITVRVGVGGRRMGSRWDWTGPDWAGLARTGYDRLGYSGPSTLSLSIFLSSSINLCPSFIRH